MSEAPTPTLEDDEATLAQYASQLVDRVEVTILGWFMRMVEERRPGLADSPEVLAELILGADKTVAALRALLAMDIADQPIGPLEVLRQAVRCPTRLLATAGVAAVARDDFSRANFPDDHYDLTPASFAGADPTLHEPGLMWGAAKAHVHLRRRRESLAE